MGPDGSVWADIKTGKSPMAQDHFQTPPDPKSGYIRPPKSEKSLKVRAKPAKAWGKCTFSFGVPKSTILKRSRNRSRRMLRS